MIRTLLLVAIVGSVTLAYVVPRMVDPKSQMGLTTAKPPVDRSSRLVDRSVLTVSRCGDGDTCTLSNGDTVRLIEIDAPELGGARCGAERTMALKARDRLSELVVGKRVELRGTGRRDQYRRLLADIVVDGRNAGGILMAERLAVRWRPGLRHERPGPWC